MEGKSTEEQKQRSINSEEMHEQNQACGWNIFCIEVKKTYSL